MARILTALLGLFFCTCAFGQVTKGNWMMGGNGSFIKTDQKNPNYEFKETTIIVSPNVGYFLVDQFAVGTRLKLDYEYRNYMNAKGRHIWLFAGPYLRYYFLDNERIVNFFSEADLQFYFNDYKGTTSTGGYDGGSSGGFNSYSLSLGTAVFLNSSVAIEGALSYERVPLYRPLINWRVFQR